MESTAAVIAKGSSNGRRPTDNAQLTFTQSTNYLVYAFALLGFNLRPGNSKSRIFCHILFAHNMLIAVLLVRKSIITSRLSPDDIHLTVRYLGYMFITVDNLINNILYRLQVHDIQAFFRGTSKILARLGGEERSFLTMLYKWRIVHMLIPSTLILWSYYMALEEWLAHKGYVQAHTNQSDEIVQLQYDYFYRLWLHPYLAFNYAIRLLPYIPLISATRYVLSYLAKHNLKAKTSPHDDVTQPRHSLNEVLHYVSIHRELCQLLRLIDKVIAPINLVYFGQITFCLLRGFRITFATGEWLKSTFLILIIMIIATLCTIAFVLIDFNYKWKVCLSRLLEMGLQLEAEGKLTRRKAFALSAKLDLYMTYVQLDEPGWSLGGLVKLKPHTIVVICSTVLCYTAYLHSK